MSAQPISGVAERATLPPCAAASSWPPKQMPSTGTPAASALRSCSISGSTQLPISAWSYADQGEPSTTTASKPVKSGNAVVTPGAWKLSAGTTRWSVTVQPRAANRSATGPAGEAWSWWTIRTLEVVAVLTELPVGHPLAEALQLVALVRQ